MFAFHHLSVLLKARQRFHLSSVLSGLLSHGELQARACQAACLHVLLNGALSASVRTIGLLLNPS
ncbi:MAG: hypothetical protein M3Q07_01710, partial [Pseudobdellovibrionaceae bacterium]|nr:hypothetical protein [Pseudobdellovibrionaceae bacterium]